MTAKQRAKVYRKIAERIADQINLSFAVCLELRDENSGVDYVWSLSELEYIFTEFFLFKNKRKSEDIWWTNGKSGNEKRILALLLSEQMALNP